MKDVPKYVVVIPQEDGSLYPIKFHSDYDEAVITANNHDASSSKKAQIRSDGPEVWKAFEEKERQERNKVSPRTKMESDDDLNIEDNPYPDEVSPGTKSQMEQMREAYGKIGTPKTEPKLVEFAIKLTQKMAMVPVVDPSQQLPNAYFYEHIAGTDMRPCGLLFWGDRLTKLFSVMVGGKQQLMIAGEGCVDVNAFMNPYASYELLMMYVERRYKLQYTNLYLPTMKPGDKIEVMVDRACTICVCGVRHE